MYLRSAIRGAVVGLARDKGAHAADILPARLEDLLLGALVQHHVENQYEHACRAGSDMVT